MILQHSAIEDGGPGGLARRAGEPPRFGEMRDIEDISAFPGWDRFSPFVQEYVARESWTADIGGGAWPAVEPDEGRGVKTVLVDIDADEIAMSNGKYTRAVTADITKSSDPILAAIDARGVDLVLSHMLIEHVTDPDGLHRTVFDLLKPGGRAIHAYPIARNVPLLVNALLPERLSRAMVRIAQPDRLIDAAEGKFPAYYRRCYPPSQRARSYFETFGYEIESHTAFSGHGYFKSIPVARNIEKLTRRMAIRFQVPIVNFGLLILSKPASSRTSGAGS